MRNHMNTFTNKMNLKKTIISLSLVTVALTSSFAIAQSKRENITAVGSSTVYPFSTVVAERFGKNTDFKTPKIESTGTGGGMKLFCAGNAIGTPDLSNASRRMKKSEFDFFIKSHIIDRSGTRRQKIQHLLCLEHKLKSLVLGATARYFFSSGLIGTAKMSAM